MEPPSVIDRVNHIADLMAKGQYRTRITVRELAKQWGLGEGAVENNALEASRLLRVPPEQLADRRAAMAAWFEQQAAEAALLTNVITGLPDRVAALKAMELYGKYAGLEPKGDEEKKDDAPKRIVVTFDEQKPKDPA